ncbi:hypothetical protein AB0I24_00455 [Brachybacterium paraconglomeratum]
MTYPPAYGPAHSYAPAPRRRRRGLKRTIFGGLGLVANAIGLVVMPIVAAMIGAMLIVTGNTEMAPLDPAGDSFEASTWSMYSIAVPQEDLGTTTCEIEGADVTVEPAEASSSMGSVDGVPYYDLYSVQVFGDQEVSVTCTGGESVALWDAGMGGFAISIGVGVLLPVVLGLVALVMLIWGIIALVRSA